MGRKLFKENNITVPGRIKSFDQFIPYTDRGEDQPKGLYIHPSYKDSLISMAEKLAGKQYPSLLASEYMRYKEDGNRIIYEQKFFERRNDLLTLAAAELVENNGRFLKQIIDLIWLICDEATWVLPAHNIRTRPGDESELPYCVDGEFSLEVNYIDLFAASTGADLAVVLYFLGDRLDGITENVSLRLRFELQRRIIKPVINRKNHRRMFWLGKYGPVNNWCPWVISNVLTVAALTEKDVQIREDIAAIALDALDVFMTMYTDEGSCDEGPSYWTVAAGALFNALGVLFDMSGGRIDIYKEPMICNMFEFISRINIEKNYVFCFADSPVRVNLKNPWVYEMGERSGSKRLREFARYMLSGSGGYSLIDSGKPYISFRQLAVDPALFVTEKDDYKAVLNDYLSDLKIAVSRENSDPKKGFFLAFKGGHNGEGHNHNDVGEIVVYKDGKPVFIDMGSGTYTRRTFSSGRYDILSLQSCYHNTATVNKFIQRSGGRIRSRDEKYDPETGELSMQLIDVYPDSGLKSYIRSSALENGVITIKDKLEFVEKGNVEYNYICISKPENTEPGVISVGDVLLEFDPEIDSFIENIEFSQPETVNIPHNWGVDTIYRIILRHKTTAGSFDDITYIRKK